VALRCPGLRRRRRAGRSRWNCGLDRNPKQDRTKAAVEAVGSAAQRYPRTRLRNLAGLAPTRLPAMSFASASFVSASSCR